ncbi:hypothetical protein NQ318_008350 [Aromia moschata]|uniref:Uncharacterized protein n=1 Tax=Aromia moschata TaxID=1265417 RepID=A0AAV8YHF4_9CUCU|nr:hypothetical protein NQ318_008350 [Aromia moschata]
MVHLHTMPDLRDWFNVTFLDRWIRRRGLIEWPARSPDLSPNDFSLGLRRKTNKKKVSIKKYGVKARRTDTEMEPLHLDDDEEDETLLNCIII